MIDQLCLEVEDPCAICEVFGHTESDRLAIEHCLRTLKTLVVLGDIKGFPFISRLRLALAAARGIFMRAPNADSPGARSVFDTLGIIEQELFVSAPSPPALPSGHES